MSGCFQPAPADATNTRSTWTNDLHRASPRTHAFGDEISRFIHLPATNSRRRSHFTCQGGSMSDRTA